MRLGSTGHSPFAAHAKEDAAALAVRFESERPRLRALAYRMLGSLSEAEDVEQETWLRLGRAEPGSIDDLPAWLTTVASRLALDALRARTRREEPLEQGDPDTGSTAVPSSDDPETEAILANEVGLALMVVLDRLGPAERLAFVLHDIFGLPFDRLAKILDRSPEAARQLASRARRRVRSAPIAASRTARQREVVEAFVRAARDGDVAGLVRLLDPDVVLRVDPLLLPEGAPQEVRGAAQVGSRARVGAAGSSGQLLLIDGRPGIAVAPRGRIERALLFRVAKGRIAIIEIVAAAERLATLEFQLVDGEFTKHRY